MRAYRSSLSVVALSSFGFSISQKAFVEVYQSGFIVPINHPPMSRAQIFSNAVQCTSDGDVLKRRRLWLGKRTRIAEGDYRFARLGNGLEDFVERVIGSSQLDKTQPRQFSIEKIVWVRNPVSRNYVDSPTLKFPSVAWVET